MELKKINFNIKNMSTTNKIKRLSLFGYKCFYYRGDYIIQIENKTIKEFIKYEDYKEFINETLLEQIELLFNGLTYDSVSIDTTKECKSIDCREITLESVCMLNIDMI